MRLPVIAIVGVPLLFAGSVTDCFADDGPRPTFRAAGADVSKLSLERPLKRVVGFREADGALARSLRTAAFNPVLGAHPPVVRQPGYLPSTSVSTKMASSRTVPSSQSTLAFKNPRVAPGRVNWHATLDDAMVEARKSGKPILLFQMMGRLDDRFC